MAEFTKGAHAAAPRMIDMPLDAGDQQMEQIRDLLFGALRQELSDRMDALERRLVALERGFAEARQQDGAARRQSFDQLATAIAELGSHVRTLAKP